MPRGKTRKKPKRARRRSLASLRFIVVTAAVAVVALLALYELLSGTFGGELAERVLGSRDLSRRSVEINMAVDRSLVKLGIADVTSERSERESGRYAWLSWDKSGKVPHGIDLVECNLALTSDVRAAGGRVIKTHERTPDWRGLRSLDLRFGFKDFETHRVRLVESSAPEEAEGDAVRRETVGGSGAPMVAIIIDDLGHNDSAVTRALLELKAPITLALLPYCPRTASVAEAARSSGKQVLLHMPMEPAGDPGVGPGEGALLSSHSTREVEELVERAIANVPHAVGVNNHMGSLLTRDRARMRSVMKVLKRNGLFFVDSMTTPLSVAYSEAERAGVPMARNSMYLDSMLDQLGTADVEAQLEELEAIARRRGSAVGIGHPKMETVTVLSKKLPEMEERGIVFVLASDLTD